MLIISQMLKSFTTLCYKILDTPVISMSERHAAVVVR